jgi:hypothetical protein
VKGCWQNGQDLSFGAPTLPTFTEDSALEPGVLIWSVILREILEVETVALSSRICSWNVVKVADEKYCLHDFLLYKSKADDHCGWWSVNFKGSWLHSSGMDFRVGTTLIRFSGTILLQVEIPQLRCKLQRALTICGMIERLRLSQSIVNAIYQHKNHLNPKFIHDLSMPEIPMPWMQ